MRNFLGPIGCLFLAACTASSSTENPSVDRQEIVAGAGYTTFDTTVQGCLDSKNGVNCNRYASKSAAYIGGGSTLADGDYYFAVLAPGSQQSGFVDGAAGNLSTDAWTSRRFSVSGGAISYSGPHALGTSPQGRAIIGLAPFADTPNEGGVYIAAICAASATSASQCKYDAFKAPSSSGVVITEGKFPVVSGASYYDANANGRWDSGEPGIPGWRIDYHDGVSDVIWSGADGTFSTFLMADSYSFKAAQAIAGTWVQTGNTVSQLATYGAATATLNADKSYDITVADDSGVSGLYFGSLCLGAGGGRTLGFWSNKNGQAMINASDLAFLSSLSLRDAAGNPFDPATNAQLKSWLLSGTATNMAYMLSVQLATMELNVRKGLVSPSMLIQAPPLGYPTVAALMGAANTALASDGVVLSGSPVRAYQEALKTALDRGNNDLAFVQPTPATCATPTF
jgi:hypothetical protein